MMPFTCAVVQVHDGDTFTCADHTKIRVAGIDANELDGSCHNACAAMPADASRRYVTALVLRRTLSCQPLGRSYARIVARCRLPDGRDLSCAAITAGAAVRWDQYWSRYRMGGCDG